LRLILVDLIKLQPNRSPFLFIGKDLFVDPGKESTCNLFLAPDLWFFSCHWPGNPNMPGTLQLEAMAQVASMSIFTNEKPKPDYLLLREINSAIFLKEIVPNKTVKITAKVEKYKRGVVTFNCNISSLEYSLIAKSRLTLVIPNSNSRPIMKS